MVSKWNWSTVRGTRRPTSRMMTSASPGGLPAHLKEFPDYYTRLDKLEREAEAYWTSRR